jgi:catechol 2,3-dioxygenase-like lactoylglutathione lyase family enzyme
MTIELDHTIVSARDKVASARQLAELLGVPWAPTTLGPFSAVYVNEGLTLDFIDADEDFPVQHFCFRVSPQEFDTILARIQVAGIPYRQHGSRSHGHAVDTQFGGKGIYWNEPEGHQWEMLTVSYAREAE